MIPKIIHYCWFGNKPLSRITLKCLNSWKTKLPDYKIILWNEKRFDVNSCLWTKEAYCCGDYAFVADYVRVYALKHFGGIYMDVDVEVIKDFSDLLINKQYVSGFVEGYLLTGGLIACEKDSLLINKIYNYYKNRHYYENGIKHSTMNPIIYTKIAFDLYDIKYGVKSYFSNTISIFPEVYFMPYCRNSFKNYNNFMKTYKINKCTFTIHHNMGSWSAKKKVVVSIVRLLLPRFLYLFLKKIKFRLQLKSLET